MEKYNMAATADWSSVEKRPSWGTVTSKELSVILGVSLQSINNWRIRGHLPEPEPRRKGQGNKNRWKISTLKNWLYEMPEEQIHWEFINTHMGKGFESIEQAIWNASRHWKAFGVERII